jgi:hypothetical protein
MELMSKNINGIISTKFQHDSVINSVHFFFTMEDFITMWMFNFQLHPLDSTKIDCTTLLSNSTRVHFVQIMSICTPYVLSLVNNLIEEVGPNYLQVSHFNHLFPQMASWKVSSCEAILGRRWFLGKRLEHEIVNSYSWLLTRLLQISHTCWGVQLNDHHSKNIQEL